MRSNGHRHRRRRRGSRRETPSSSPFSFLVLFLLSSSSSSSSSSFSSSSCSPSIGWGVGGVGGRFRPLPDVADVDPRAEDAHQLVFVVVDVALHDVHARAEQPLERLHVQNCDNDNNNKVHVFSIRITEKPSSVEKKKE